MGTIDETGDQTTVTCPMCGVCVSEEQALTYQGCCSRHCYEALASITIS